MCQNMPALERVAIRSLLKLRQTCHTSAVCEGSRGIFYSFQNEFIVIFVEVIEYLIVAGGEVAVWFRAVGMANIINIGIGIVIRVIYGDNNPCSKIADKAIIVPEQILSLTVRNINVSSTPTGSYFNRGKVIAVRKHKRHVGS